MNARYCAGHFGGDRKMRELATAIEKYTGSENDAFIHVPLWLIQYILRRAHF